MFYFPKFGKSIGAVFQLMKLSISGWSRRGGDSMKIADSSTSRIWLEMGCAFIRMWYFQTCSHFSEEQKFELKFPHSIYSRMTLVISPQSSQTVNLAAKVRQ